MRHLQLLYFAGVLKRLVAWSAVINLVLFCIWFGLRSNLIITDEVKTFLSYEVETIHKVSFLFWTALVAVWCFLLVASRAHSVVVSAFVSAIAVSATGGVYITKERSGLSSLNRTLTNSTPYHGAEETPWAQYFGGIPSRYHLGDCAKHPARISGVTIPFITSSVTRPYIGWGMDFDCTSTLLGVDSDEIRNGIVFGLSPFLVLILLLQLRGLRSRWDTSKPERSPSRFATPTSLAAAFLAILVMDSALWLLLNEGELACVTTLSASGCAAIVSILWKRIGWLVSFTLGAALCLIGVVFVVDPYYFEYSLGSADAHAYVAFIGLLLIAISVAFPAARGAQPPRFALRVVLKT